MITFQIEGYPTGICVMFKFRIFFCRNSFGAIFWKRLGVVVESVIYILVLVQFTIWNQGSWSRFSACCPLSTYGHRFALDFFIAVVIV